MKKKAIELSFSLIFGILVGAMILFLALYLSGKLIKTETEIKQTTTAKELGILFNPLEAGMLSERITKLKMPKNVDILNDCDISGRYGNQKLSAIKNKNEEIVWTNFPNKYVFSKRRIGGDMLVFSKPFEFPYKIADLLFIFDEGELYCFVKAPDEIKEDLSSLVSSLNLSQFIFTEQIKDCNEKSTKICFAYSIGEISDACNIKISTNGIVTKNKRALYYVDSLLYGAIFSDPEIYECQVKRLITRTGILAELYIKKSDILSLNEMCHFETIRPLLYKHIEYSRDINSSIVLTEINKNSEQIRRINEDLVCKLF